MTKNTEFISNLTQAETVTFDNCASSARRSISGYFLVFVAVSHRRAADEFQRRGSRHAGAL